MSGKPSKLIFKGEKKHKKKKRSRAEALDDNDLANATDQGWVLAETVDDLVGPLYITHPSEPPVCFTIDEDDHLLAYPLSDDQSHSEPTIVNQVFVGARLVGTTNTFTFKSCHQKYLRSDKFGVVSADSEAISGLEEWNPSITDAGIAFQNAHNKFMMIDEVANKGFRIRADSEEVGFCETFRVYCQSRFKRKAKKEKKEKVDESSLEIDNVRKYQSWGGGRLHTTKEDRRELKRAKQEGRAAEAMLDRRAKVKSDRYCK